MPKFNVKVEVHKYQDLSDKPVERMLPIEADDEEDAVYKMRELLDEERRKDAAASGVGEAYGAAIFLGGKGGSKRYVGRALMGHAKLVKESARAASERRASAIEEEAARSRSTRVTSAGSWGGGYK